MLSWFKKPLVIPIVTSRFLFLCRHNRITTIIAIATITLYYKLSEYYESQHKQNDIGNCLKPWALLFFFWKLTVQPKDRFIQGVQSNRPLVEPNFKPEIWTRPLKLTTKGIEPNTLWGSHSKVLSQHHKANPQWGYLEPYIAHNLNHCN